MGEDGERNSSIIEHLGERPIFGLVYRIKSMHIETRGRSMKISDYELLFDLPDGEIGGAGIDGVRTVTIRAGRSLEVMCHPITKLSAEARREARERRTSPAMMKLNLRNAERHIMRIMEENFTGRAWVVTLTYAYPTEDYGMANLRELADEYEKRGLPWELERLKMDFRNFLNRLKRRARRGAEIRWIVRYEEGKRPPAEGLPPKYHCHVLIEGPGITREMIDACWPHGSTKCDAFETRDDGPARMARYICKEKAMGMTGRNWWSHSRNLRVPEAKVSDRKISRRRLSRIAADLKHSGREIFAALYPGYKLVEEPSVTYSDFVAGAYIYARLRRIEPNGNERRQERMKARLRGWRT